MGEPEPAGAGVDQQARRQRLARGGEALERSDGSSSRATTVSSNSSASSDAARRSRWARRIEPADPRHDDLGEALPRRRRCPRRATGRARGGTADCRCWRARRGAPRSVRARVPPRRAAGRRRRPRRARAGRRRSTSAPLSRSGPTRSHPTPASPVRRVAQQTSPRQPGSRSRSRSASSDGSSAHWTSSTTSRQPRGPPPPRRAARANSANRSAVLVGSDLGHQLAAHPERRRAVLRALRPADTRRARVGERPHQARLADARLALDDDEPRGSERNGLGHAPQPRQARRRGRTACPASGESIGRARRATILAGCGLSLRWFRGCRSRST